MRTGSDAIALERVLARLSADEIVAALRLAEVPRALRASLRAVLLGLSTPLGRKLARFDERIAAIGLAAASSAVLADFGARWSRTGDAPPAGGPLLVVANHPGAYDALVLFAAIGRDDVATVAADRPFLRAMRTLAPHLVFVPDPPASPDERARGLRRALKHLSQGGALLHFGAGRIEPDPAFDSGGNAPALQPWSPGTGALVRGAAAARGSLVAAIVEGVHSAAAKRLLFTRLAERRGVTTLPLLLQVAVKRYRDVAATARFGPTIDAREFVREGGDSAALSARMRERAQAVLESRRP